ncbi:hypothetical protein Tsubulata_051171, partial [Turnera subulata]
MTLRFSFLLWQDIESSELIAETRTLLPQETEDLIKKKEEFFKKSKFKEITWRQNSRIRWLILGYRNSSFFHLSACARSRRNKISSILVGDKVLEEPDLIKKKEPTSFFSIMYCELFSNQPSIGSILLPKIDPHTVISLERPITMDEIEAIIGECDSDKAPGPDGLN